MTPYDGTRHVSSPASSHDSEEQLRAKLEAMAPAEAEEILSQLATAIFPTGIGDLSQLTWSAEGTSEPARNVIGPSDADVKLRTAELRYRTLIEQIPAVTFMAVLGEGDNEIYVSPHIEALLGFTQSEWLENPFLWYTQLHPDDREIWHEEFARGCRTGGPFRAECRFLARDGRVVWVHGEARLIKDERGRPLFLQGVAFDITEAKRAHALLVREAVRTTEQRYRDLVEQLGAIFWEAEVGKPGFTFVSSGAERILGYPPARWLADPDFWLTRVHSDDRVDAARAWARAQERQSGADEFEYRALDAKDRTVWLQQKVYASRAPTGEARLLGVIIDITDRKRAEEILLANEARLQSEANIRRTLHRIGTVLASELDLERVVQLATDEATVLTTAQFGAFFYNVVDEHGQLSTRYTVSGASRDGLAKSSMLRTTEGLNQTFSREGIVRLDDVTKDPRFGKNAPFNGMAEGDLPVRSYLALPVISRSGEVLGGMLFGHSRIGVFTQEHEHLAAGIMGWTGVAIENARLFRAAEKARASAETANRAKDQFLATMSHELRTPLNAVLGWATILRTSGADEATRRRAAETIERNARAQAQIIEDLLDVSRIATGNLRLDIGAVDLVSVIDSTLDSMGPASDTKRIQVRRRLDRSIPRVVGDASRLRQVVSNVVTNAVKFTPAGGSIEVRLARTDGMAQISVEDNGQGIGPEFLPHVFERFRQADGSAARAHGGLGLGLAIVRHLVDLHGGTVRIESPGLGRGTMVTIEIPLRQAEVLGYGADDTAAIQGSAKAARTLDGVRVLVVDDEVDSLDLIAHVLEHAGAIVATVGSAAEALDVIDAWSPDVLVSDVGLPQQDGCDLLRSLRQRRSPSSVIPAIAVTAYARSEDRDEALAAGFQAHVPKPIAARDLLAAVESLATTARQHGSRRSHVFHTID